MKTSAYVRLLAVASFAMAPFAAYSQDVDSTQACIDAFVAKNYPGQSPLIRVERERSLGMPLQFRQAAAQVKVTAANRDSGRVILSATCSTKKGVVTLTPDFSAAAAIIASR